MNPFFAYLIKSSISLAVLYSLFRFTMRNDKNHKLNRFLLLGILVVSAIIPFLNIQFSYEEVGLKQVEVIREFVSAPVFADASPQEIIQPINEASSFSINSWLVFYVLITVTLLFRIVFGVIKVSQIIKRAEKRRFQKIVLAVVKELIQPFTFLNKVVISEKDFTENKDIIVAHEYAHIKHLHALDLMLCELFTIMHFFNPFMWLLRRDLKLIHEYQADQAVLNKGIDAKKYQLLVLQKSVGERRFAMANHFTQKPILKRIKMMQQKNRKQWAAVKLILFLPLLVLLLQAFARPELITNTEDFIPVKYTENKTEQWLSKWTADNIGKGFYEPELDDIDAPRKGNNVLVILMNQNDDFLIEDQRKNKEEIKQIVKNYLLGTNPDGKNGPDYMETKIPGIGKMKVSKGMIVYKHDLASSKEMVNYTLRSIGEACLEVRKEKAQILFAKDYFDLKEEQQLAVNMAVPIWFEYDLPNSPAPNYWSPFYDEIEGPVPMTITFKSNGNVIVENHKFNSFEEFEENLKYWKAELEKYNVEKRKEAYYRAHVIFEKIPSSEQKHIEYILYKNGVTIKGTEGRAAKITSSFILNPKVSSRDLENIKQRAKNNFDKYDGDFYVLVQYKDGVTKDEIELVKEIYTKLGITEVKFVEYKEPKKTSPQFLLRLYPDEIQNVLANPITINDVSNYAENWLNGVGENYGATIYAYQNVSEERIQQLKQEMKKGGINVDIVVKKMPIPNDKLNSQIRKTQHESKSELFIPKGFSPNNDGIHDYLIIQEIYPQFPDAKLTVFSENGEKLYEQEHYGNGKFWSKDKVWWSGSSDKKSAVESDGKLPVGNYNYVLELENGQVKKGSVLLAKSAPPKLIKEKWDFSNLNDVGKVTTFSSNQK